MSLSLCLPGSVVLSKVASLLSLSDLCCLERSNSEAKALLGEEVVVWWLSTSSALPSFKLSRNLFSKGRRSQFMALFKVLAEKDVRMQPRLRVALPGLPEARRLANILDRALQAASAHRLAGGSFAEVAIVALRFDPVSVRHVFDGATRGPAHGLREQPVCLGKGSALRLEGRGHGCRRSLRLHLAMQSEVVFATARTDGVPPDAVSRQVDFSSDALHQPLTLDLTSLSPALTLCYRGADLCTNLGWQPLSSGIVAASRGQAAAAVALVDGFPCVVSLRDGASTQANVSKALHVDSPKTR